METVWEKCLAWFRITMFRGKHSEMSLWGPYVMLWKTTQLVQEALRSNLFLIARARVLSASHTAPVSFP